jgi:hypothetical protein
MKNQRSEIKERGNGLASLEIDPKQTALEQEAAKLESQLQDAQNTPVEPTPEELEFQAKALLKRAEQIKTESPVLLPDQPQALQFLRTHYLKLYSLGFSLQEAMGVIQSYSSIAAVEAALLRKIIKK